MSQLVQKWYGIDGQEDNWADTVDGNLLGENEVTSKISISAPPGTIVQLVSRAQQDIPKRILIGQSGIYDFSYDGIEIQEISFPSRTEEESALKDEVDGVMDQVKTIADNIGESPYSDQDRTAFCESMKDLFYLDSSLTLYDIVTSWLEQSAKMQGNDNLNNVIVNYILVE